MRSRRTLHKTKLNEYIEYCKSQGWVQEEIKGAFEVLRMRHEKHKKPLIVYQRDNLSQHYTTYDISQSMTDLYIRSKIKD